MLICIGIYRQTTHWQPRNHAVARTPALGAVNAETGRTRGCRHVQTWVKDHTQQRQFALILLLIQYFSIVCFESVACEGITKMEFDTEQYMYEIENRPALWNMKCKEYSDRVLKIKMWEEIVNIFGEKEMTTVEKKQLGNCLVFFYVAMSCVIIMYMVTRLLWHGKLKGISVRKIMLQLFYNNNFYYINISQLVRRICLAMAKY